MQENLYLYFSVKDVLDKAFDRFRIESITGWLVLSHVLSQSNIANGGALVTLKPEEFQDPLVVIIVNVDVDEQNLMKQQSVS